MRSFFVFIIRNYAVILFILLELLSFWLIFNNNAYHKTFFLNTANSVTGNVLNTYGSLTQYFYLKNINDSLQAENANLRSELSSFRSTDSVNLYEVKSTQGDIIYSYIPAEVISNSYTDANNYITLNKGSRDGIQKDKGIITSNGIAGKIITVSENFSVAMSVLHGNFLTRGAVKKNGTQGQIHWSAGDPTVVQMVDVSEPGELQPGDTIITTADSQLFPNGILIGTLKDYGRDEATNFYTLNIKLATNFSRLHTVYVVNYLKQAEQQQAEDEAINNAGN